MTIILNLFGNQMLCESLAKKMGGVVGQVDCHLFPDKECRIQIKNNVKNENVVVVTSLDHPNDKLIPLILLLSTARDLGAKKIGLVSPYLCYMRQDTRFKPGEGISANIIGRLLSQYIDFLTTIDPHLHRIDSLSDVYPIKTIVVRAAPAIVDWIKNTVENPVLIGPDRESEQWVSDIAKKIPAPFLILSKTRRGDNKVEFSLPDHEQYADFTPILIDDIISSGNTMTESAKFLNTLKLTGNKRFSPICIGIHAVFAGDAYQKLLDANVQQIVTCNTISHASNAINVISFIADAVSEQF